LRCTLSNLHNSSISELGALLRLSARIPLWVEPWACAITAGATFGAGAISAGCASLAITVVGVVGIGSQEQMGWIDA
jgi:hypothetical protein